MLLGQYKKHSLDFDFNRVANFATLLKCYLRPAASNLSYRPKSKAVSFALPISPINLAFKSSQNRTKKFKAFTIE